MTLQELRNIHYHIVCWREDGKNLKITQNRLVISLDTSSESSWQSNCKIGCTSFPAIKVPSFLTLVNIPNLDERSKSKAHVATLKKFK